MDALGRLVAIAEIEALVARRCRSLDEKDWETYAACHTPDVVSHAIATESGTGEPVHGIEPVLEFLRRELDGWTTVHLVHAPEIAVTSETAATGVWAMEDRLWREDGSWMHGFGRYHETYEHRGGRWLIGSRKLERTRVERGRRPVT